MRKKRQLDNNLDGPYWNRIQPPIIPPPPPARKAMHKGPIHIRRPPAPPVSKMPLARHRPPGARRRIFKKLPKKPANPPTEVEEPSSEPDEDQEIPEQDLRRNFVQRIVLEGEQAQLEEEHEEDSDDDERNNDPPSDFSLQSISSVASRITTGCINCGGRPVNYIMAHGSQRAALRHLNLILCTTCALIPKYLHEMHVAYRIRNINPNPFGPPYPPLRRDPLTLREIAARSVTSSDAVRALEAFEGDEAPTNLPPPEAFMNSRFYGREREQRPKKTSNLAEDEPS